MSKTMVKAVVCSTCGDIVYSRAQHDFRRCTCGDIFVDGGFEYLRVGYNKVRPEEREVEVAATRRELYDDWNQQGDKFGRIKGDE